MSARFTPLTSDDPREVGGYTLRARLGAGGMGRVYLAFSPGGRALAVKAVRPEYAEDPEFRRRFRKEIEAAQSVQGLYTAPVVDADSEAPVPWLATAYVPGPTLQHAVLEHGPLPLQTVFRLLAGVAEGLEAIHSCGLIHRDLKPANVILAADGPRVIDFGIAHAADATTVTRTNVAIGTPAFMAPEQARGRAAMAATDVFALGGLAVFAATGRTAFGEGNPDVLLYRVVNEPADLGGCPPALRPLAKRALAKDPRKRPALTEVMEYARKQTEGMTVRLAESWLPEKIVKSLSGYDTTRYETPLTGPVGPPGKTKVDSAAGNWNWNWQGNGNGNGNGGGYGGSKSKEKSKIWVKPKDKPMDGGAKGIACLAVCAGLIAWLGAYGPQKAIDELSHYLRTSSSPTPPAYTTPTPEYTPPAPAYTTPTPEYTPPAPAYTPPTPEYTPPAPAYTPPTPVYTPPAPAYTPTMPVYTPPAINYGAIAVAGDGSTGRSWNYGSAAAASQMALDDCPGSDCKVIEQFVSSCGAVAYNPGTRMYWGGQGATPTEAKNNAISNAGGGRWIVWVCTTR